MHAVCPQCGTVNRVPDARLDDQPVCARCKADLLPRKAVLLDDARLPTYLANSDQPVLVDFWATWCGPCQAMAPHFEQAAALLPGVRLVKVETDENPQASAFHRIRSIPTLVLFQGGREVARRSGALPAQELARWVQASL